MGSGGPHGRLQNPLDAGPTRLALQVSETAAMGQERTISMVSPATLVHGLLGSFCSQGTECCLTISHTPTDSAPCPLQRHSMHAQQRKLQNANPT